MPRTAAVKEARPQEERYFTVKEAAAFVKMSEVSIRRFLTQGKLRRLKCGSRTLLERSEVLSLVQEAK